MSDALMHFSMTKCRDLINLQWFMGFHIIHIWISFHFKKYLRHHFPTLHILYWQSDCITTNILLFTIQEEGAGWKGFPSCSCGESVSRHCWGGKDHQRTAITLPKHTGNDSRVFRQVQKISTSKWKYPILGNHYRILSRRYNFESYFK